MTTLANKQYIPDELLKTKLLRNGFWLYFFAFIAAPTWYIIKLLIARTLSVEDIGIFYSVLGVVTLLVPYHDLWLSQALQYYIPRYLIHQEYDKTKSIAIYTLLVQLITGIIIGAWLWIGADRLALHYFKSDVAVQLLQYFSVYFVLYSVSKAFESFFLSTQHIKWSQWLWAIRMRTIVLLVLGAIRTDSLTIINFALIRLIGVVAKIIVWSLWFYRLFGELIQKSKTIWSRSLFNRQWKYWFRVMLGSGTTTLIGQINQQFALFISAESAAQRAYYLSFHTIVAVITGPLISYLFPLLNELYTRKQTQKIDHLYKLLFIGVIGFWLLGGWLAYYLSERFSVLLYGEAFREAGVLFTHYAPFVFTIPLMGILFQDIASRGMVRERVYVLGIGLIANIIASYYLWTHYGLVGLVYSQLIANLILILWGRRYYNKPKQPTIV